MTLKIKTIAMGFRAGNEQEEEDRERKGILTRTGGYRVREGMREKRGKAKCKRYSEKKKRREYEE